MHVITYRFQATVKGLLLCVITTMCKLFSYIRSIILYISVKSLIILDQLKCTAKWILRKGCRHNTTSQLSRFVTISLLAESRVQTETLWNRFADVEIVQYKPFPFSNSTLFFLSRVFLCSSHTIFNRSVPFSTYLPCARLSSVLFSFEWSQFSATVYLPCTRQFSARKTTFQLSRSIFFQGFSSFLQPFRHVVIPFPLLYKKLT